MIKETIKKQIDSMDYESMLRLWRTAPAGHHMFQGEVGDYFSTVMAEKKDKLPDGEAVRASKNIGWGI